MKWIVPNATGARSPSFRRVHSRPASFVLAVVTGKISARGEERERMLAIQPFTRPNARGWALTCSSDTMAFLKSGRCIVHSRGERLRDSRNLSCILGLMQSGPIFRAGIPNASVSRWSSVDIRATCRDQATRVCRALVVESIQFTDEREETMIDSEFSKGYNVYAKYNT